MTRALDGRNMRLVLAALLPTAATVLAWVPYLFSRISPADPSETAPTVLLVGLVWSAPTVALAVNWRWPAATDMSRAMLLGLPQVVVSPAMARLWVWMEIERGYLRPDSSEAAMAVGAGTLVALLLGALLCVLVACAGRLGVWLRRRDDTGRLATGASASASGPPRRRRQGAAAVAALLLVGALAAVAVTQSNDFICSAAEQRAMAEFAPYDTAELAWGSDAQITGGCTASYVVVDSPEAVQTYYRQLLGKNGWTVRDGPADSGPSVLVGERDDLRFRLTFAGADSADPSSAGERSATLKPGQIQVTLAGGHRG